ncbi:MAG: ribonuclease III [Thermodesulfobacteriota bacterium]
MDEERLASLKELERRLGYQFNRIEWLDQALTHKSFIHQTTTPLKESNEVLEFLGDAVLNLAVSHLLLKTFPGAHEGILSMRRAHLVKRSSLAHLCKKIQLEDHLLLGKSELIDGGRKKSSILANAYEALIGAIYMDAGFDQTFEVLQRQLEPYLQAESASFLYDDYKSLLQEQVQRTHAGAPKYQVLQEEGPDHDKRFQASVSVGGEVKGIGWGKSKKRAEQEAAKQALEEISTKPQAPNYK